MPDVLFQITDTAEFANAVADNVLEQIGGARLIDPGTVVAAIHMAIEDIVFPDGHGEDS